MAAIKPHRAALCVVVTRPFFSSSSSSSPFNPRTCAIVCSSGAAAVAAAAAATERGSDSHDASRLFVLPCGSSARLCLAPPSLSARCLRGKVSLPAPASPPQPARCSFSPPRHRALRGPFVRPSVRPAAHFDVIPGPISSPSRQGRSLLFTSIFTMLPMCRFC